MKTREELLLECNKIIMEEGEDDVQEIPNDNTDTGDDDTNNQDTDTDSPEDVGDDAGGSDDESDTVDAGEPEDDTDAPDGDTDDDMSLDDQAEGMTFEKNMNITIINSVRKLNARMNKVKNIIGFLDTEDKPELATNIDLFNSLYNEMNLYLEDITHKDFVDIYVFYEEVKLGFEAIMLEFSFIMIDDK